MMSCGRGGQPGTHTSTGTMVSSERLSTVGLPANTLPLAGQEPSATTALGLGTWL